MIVLDSELLSGWIVRAQAAPEHTIQIVLHEKDDGDVYSSFAERGGAAPSKALFRVAQGGDSRTEGIVAPSGDHLVLVVAERNADGAGGATLHDAIDGRYRLRGFARRIAGDVLQPTGVMVAPVKEQLFSRLRGIFETSVLADRKILLVGVGSGSSPVALELAKSGIRHFILIDHDRLEVGNVARHVCGISDLGRFKTLAVRDAILEKNPAAVVQTHECAVETEFVSELTRLVSEVDLVICGTDNRESRMLVNRCCVEEGKTCLYGGAFRRAYGGQVLRVRPQKSLCYQCFIDALPGFASDEEISQESQVIRVQYSPADPSVPIEPGLSTDIVPLSVMLTKLAILELLRGETTTLNSLYDDCVADWYLWLNRREPGTDYAELEPLAYDTDGIRILRWYGIEVERNPFCPVCGDFVARFTASIESEDLEYFADQM